MSGGTDFAIHAVDYRQSPMRSGQRQFQKAIHHPFDISIDVALSNYAPYNAIQ